MSPYITHKVIYKWDAAPLEAVDELEEVKP